MASLDITDTAGGVRYANANLWSVDPVAVEYAAAERGAVMV